MSRALKYVLGGSFILLAGLFWLAYLSSRPPLTIDPATLAGDGSQINYCELPVLDGRGLTASDIPKGNTPGCGYSQFPLPVLKDCTEPLSEGADDIRGLWRAIGAREPVISSAWSSVVSASSSRLLALFTTMDQIVPRV